LPEIEIVVPGEPLSVSSSILRPAAPLPSNNAGALRTANVTVLALRSTMTGMTDFLPSCADSVCRTLQ
jgi:hypothetical protein